MIDITKQELIEALLNAASEGKLITPKHDPYLLKDRIYKFPRSVISYEGADNPEEFIRSGNFSITEYIDHRYGDERTYIEIIPYPDSFETVPASGVGPNSVQPFEKLYTLVAVCGGEQGWHIYGEKSDKIDQMVSCGELEYIGKES